MYPAIASHLPRPHTFNGSEIAVRIGLAAPLVAGSAHWRALQVFWFYGDPTYSILDCATSHPPHAVNALPALLIGRPRPRSHAMQPFRHPMPWANLYANCRWHRRSSPRYLASIQLDCETRHQHSRRTVGYRYSVSIGGGALQVQVSSIPSHVDVIA